MHERHSARFDTRRFQGQHASWAFALVLGSAIGIAACGSDNGGGGGTGATADDGGGGAGDDGGANCQFGCGGGTTDSGEGGSTKPKVSPCDAATCGAAGGTCTADVCVITENAGSVDPATQASLAAGGAADGTFKWLYPYDKTVFPRGLLPPTLQFGGTAPDSIYVHVTAPALDYKGYFGASSPARVSFSAAVWSAITYNVHAAEDVKVEVTKSSGGAVTGPTTETWRVAQGNVKGTIYYETYGSTLAGGSNSVGIMRIDPGATVPAVLKKGCGNVCHTASADGSTLVAAVQYASTSASYDLKNSAAVIKTQSDSSFTYGGLTPDGSLVLSATNVRGYNGTAVSALYDTHTGAKVAATGWDTVIKKSGTPAFSPDGKFVAFNHEDTGSGRTLATMGVDLTTKTFTGLADIATDPSRTLGWPAFTPDSKYVVYHAGSSATFETDANATGDLYATDLATHTVRRLDALDGYTGAGSATYLPASDPNLNFAPTVLPEAVGGYFWVLFTSHRSYGNTLASKDNGDQNGKLWLAAYDINPAPGSDGSHPAIYLDGQEASADNLRGFWVLAPCKADGQGCAGGDECCGGYCRPGGDGGALVCVPPPGGCSNEFEKCTTAADCCDPTMSCINGRCAQSAVK